MNIEPLIPQDGQQPQQSTPRRGGNTRGVVRRIVYPTTGGEESDESDVFNTTRAAGKRRRGNNTGGGSGAGQSSRRTSPNTTNEEEATWDLSDMETGAGAVEESPMDAKTTAATRNESQIETIAGDDTLDCSVGENMRYGNRNKLSPWKVIAKHTGTRRTHYHIIYISTAKNWGHNSKLGKIIRSREHKCSQIACIQCLLEYITTGADRTTLKQILTERDKKTAMCVAHSLGLDPKQANSNVTHTEGRNNIFPRQGTERATVSRPVDFTTSIANENIFEITQHHEQQSTECANANDGIGDQQNTVLEQTRLNHSSRRAKLIRENQDLVLHLCKNKAFDEGEATRLLCSTPEGIAVQFNRNFGERLTTALRIAKTLVFQESHKQRIERSKQYELQQDPSASDPETVEEGLDNLVTLLDKNAINIYHFAERTKKHFYGQTEKKNNLFFLGPPSTGKTMLMNSLVNMHYNITRLTGLTPNSSFNFASLIHTNACFMDECKLTDNQFEQWKLLAARQPMSTDVKYKNRQDIKDCILYTASNFPICTYVTVTEANDAVETRTISFYFTQPTTYFKINPFIWEAFWNIYGPQEQHVELNKVKYNH